MGRAQEQGCGQLTPREEWSPRAQNMICRPGGTRGSPGKEQRFSQRRLVQGEGLGYSTGITSRLVRAPWELEDTPATQDPLPAQSQNPERYQLPGKAGPGYLPWQGLPAIPTGASGPRAAPAT